MRLISATQLATLLFTIVAGQALALEPLPTPIATVDTLPHTLVISQDKQSVVNRELGLGPLEKRGGRWHFKNSERLTGTLHSWTWQVTDGYLSSDLHRELSESLAQKQDTEKLFGCVGKRCGPGAQWASGVFKQRILFGRDRDQLYSVYRIGKHRLLIYSSARSASRQHIHIEWFQLPE